jgi:hypothetical protein
LSPMWTDTIDQIATRFGISPESLCTFNNLTDCSVLSWTCSALKIPTSTPARG